MKIVAVTALSILLLALLLFVDRKIKGRKTVFLKILSFVFFTLLITGSIYFYGSSFLESFSVDVRSFTKIKGFFSLRILAALSVLFFVLFVLVKSIYVNIWLHSEQNVSNQKEAKIVALVSIVFDIAVVPDIILFGNAFFALPVILIIVIEGLALLKLVFSNFIYNKKEVTIA